MKADVIYIYKDACSYSPASATNTITVGAVGMLLIYIYKQNKKLSLSPFIAYVKSVKITKLKINFVLTLLDSSDTLVSFSNTGNCIDIYAPGVNIGTISTSGNPVLASGTSFSAPFVSGAAALLYSQAAGKGICNKILPRDIKNRILNTSTQDILHGIHESNNRLLYSDIVYLLDLLQRVDRLE